MLGVYWGLLAMSEPQGMPAPPPAAKAPGSHQADEDLLLLAVLSAREAQATPSTLEEGWDKGHWASNLCKRPLNFIKPFTASTVPT